MSSMSSMEAEIIKIQKFKMTNDSISTFHRITLSYSDCVPNALFLLGLISSVTAEIMRILVVKNGVDNEETEKIFSYLIGKPCLLLKIKNTVLYQYSMTELNPNEAIYCVSNRPGDPRHAFLIAKTNDGILSVLDGQKESGIMCEIKGEDSECWSSYKSDFYDIIHTYQSSD